MEKPILQPPNMEKDYKIYADANTVAISGVLMQSGENEDDYMIAYTSRKLTAAEKRYPIIELKLLTEPALAFWRPYANKNLAAPDHHKSQSVTIES